MGRRTQNVQLDPRRDPTCGKAVDSDRVPISTSSTAGIPTAETSSSPRSTMALSVVAQSPRQWDEVFKMGYVDVVDLAGSCWRHWEGNSFPMSISPDILHSSVKAKQREQSELWRTGAVTLPPSQPQQPPNYAPSYPSNAWPTQASTAQPQPQAAFAQNQDYRGGAPPNPPPISSYAQQQPGGFRMPSAATWQNPTPVARITTFHEMPGSGTRDSSTFSRPRDFNAGETISEDAEDLPPVRRYQTMHHSGNSHKTRSRQPDKDKVESSKGQNKGVHPSPEFAFSRPARSQTEAPRSFGHENSLYDSENESGDDIKIERRIPGFLWPEDQEPIKVLAYPDDGANFNVMTLKFANKKGFYVRKDPEYRHKVDRPVQMTSIGQTHANFIFSREPGTVHTEWFAVFDTENRRDVILGRNFLTRTRTLDLNFHRIAQVEVSKQGERIRDSHGSEIVTQKLLHGYLNNEFVRAMPDGGSVVNLMSEAYALQRGFSIKKVSDDPTKALEFYDGSIQQVEGEVEAHWSFEDDPHNPVPQKFRIYRLCPHQILLGQPVLYNPALAHSAYVEHAHSFHSSENFDGLFDLGPISWSRRKAAKATISPPPQTTSARERSDEIHRKITAEKEYMELTGLARAEAEERERLRRQEWERLHPPSSG